MVGLTFTWMIISFSRILFRQFIEQRQRIHDQEKEKEKMKLEQELERAKLVEKQKEDLEHQVAERTAELKLSLENLKATQAQLIQNEKMASLGEMTAGIAHEIQNPLNFVNNFAEVNVELADEIKSELASAVPDEKRRTLLFELLDSMAGNQEKIRMHGKRADNIVKNMLQHSRAGASKKEATDLNALVEEYTKLSYHGLRARDKSFNAGYELDLDPSLGKAEILPQEFGRVVLNLVNNAFYAVSEKMKQGIPGYAPGIIVQTRAIFGNGSGSTQKKPGSDTSPVSFMLTVRDNGPGIPDRVKEKIFQPFFTTKPSGEGTGLGLSISYDIITKGHGGRIWATSEDGAGTTFHVEIPTGK
jgi:signal transduction histidine kinase